MSAFGGSSERLTDLKDRYIDPPREHGRYTVRNDENNAGAEPSPLEPFENGFDQPLGFDQFGLESGFPVEEVRRGASWSRV